MSMVTIASFEIFSAELPFRVKFKHSAAERTTSSSIFVKCTTEAGTSGWGESLPADDLDGLAELVKETGLGVMADESFTTGASLRELIRRQACTAVSVRISKCGGLVASLARCREALAAGLTLQVGCQVGESSLISAAQLALLSEIEGVTYAEGCFGQLLLQKDPVKPVLTFGRGGRPPQRPTGPGFGVEVDESLLRRHSTSTVTI
jgi:L-alanine-DL-glutamate epimerase-like enolase superfamily enzyme